MITKVVTAFIAVMTVFLLTLSLYNRVFPVPTAIALRFLSPPISNAILQQVENHPRHVITRHVTVSVLLPGWQILVIATSLPATGNNLTCFFPNNHSSPANVAGGRTLAAFKCELPVTLRRGRLLQPTLGSSAPSSFDSSELLKWNYLAYDSLTTENEIILFVKGINNRQGVHRPVNELGCFVNGVRTSVITAVQEVFRCRRPNITEFGGKITLETVQPKQNLTVLVPSIAYYKPPQPTLVKAETKKLICACTMVYNVAKFLKEWVTWHASIGVEKFVIYDNESDDDLSEVVKELIDKGFDVSTVFWLWPKSQEAGFSHCAVVYKNMCKWMMYVDVDEFVYSPNWVKESLPSKGMLGSMVGRATGRMIGQVMIACYEFGPSDQREHPKEGVTQGYNCRRREANRHKSIVLLDAIDESLHNVVHHFQLKRGYRSIQMRVEDAIVNHYKYQAWSEFKTKYRRRVSAYVVDWTRAANLASKDRAPGLGVVPVEPTDWPKRFCEVHDNNLRDLTKLWFGHQSLSEHYMDWQR